LVTRKPYQDKKFTGSTRRGGMSKMGDMPTVIEKRKTLKNEAPHPPLTKTISLSAALQLYDVIMSNYAYYGFI
jgi:hypothetical protein